MNWNRWNWLNDLILPIALSVMRVCALWLWLALLRHFLLPSYAGPLLSAAEMLGMLLFSLFLARVGVHWIRPLNRARLLVAVTGLILIFLLLWDHLYPSYGLLDGRWLRLWVEHMLLWEDEPPPAYLLLFALSYLWLRGIWDGSRTLSYPDASAAFISGSLSIVIFLLLSNLDTQPPPPQTSTLILLFFAAALIALSLSSLKRGRAHEVVIQGDNNLSLNRYWVSSSLIVIGLLLVIALILNLLIAPEGMHQILAWIGNALIELFLFVVKLVSLILYPLLLLLSRLIIPLLQQIFGGSAEERVPPEELQPYRPEALPENIEPLIQRMPEEARWVIALAAVLVLGIIFALVLRRLRDDDSDEVREERESIFSLDLLRRQLGQLLPTWLMPGAALTFGALSGGGEARLAIRKLYQNLLVLAQARGWPRAKQQTPLEYGRALHQPFREQKEAIDTMTTHYLQARYAPEPPTPDQVQAMQQAWQQLQSDGAERE